MENSNSQPTRNLTQMGGHTRKIVESMRRLPGSDSSTTSPTQAERTSAAPLTAGAGAGKSGSTLTPSGLGRWEKAQLAPLNLPEVTTRTFSSSLLSAIVHTPVSRWDAKGNLIPSNPRFQMKLGMPRAEIQHNLRAVVAGLVHARDSEVVPVVAALKARTRGRAEGEGEARFNANVLVTDLCGYPIDVVKAACDAWIDTPDGKWFPAWADLKTLCEERMRGRRALEKGLNWMLEMTP